ncbi:RNA 2',3'-cyclic phosphodiesterase [Alkalihalobacillus sp. AL-G]|uniref:RNA 2',3'-cyclic phosphodiesterase n=1 Tax=Alkalihalobacillus sp. AL-G TaxID=2926399 RepID=UPI00272B2ED1|nr:RNA 2',3'-cyclic phosphodiesterase [Alkalihalobacillus sp. AL-G]WLD92427.1 RNA 2',3'-cyclic phosphodiesterase [Alkalihalobacillus sp. AL-G]
MGRHTFLAVPLPERIQQQIAAFSTQAKSVLPLKKWTGTRDYHITLSFLGDSSENQLNGLKAELEKKMLFHNPFHLVLNDIGVFGNPLTPSVFWLGVNPSEPLSSLQGDVEAACSTAGFRIENRSYRPHITIGKRWNGAAGQSVSLKELPTPDYLESLDWKVDEIILYEIHPQQQPMYVPWHRFRLDQEEH